MICTGTTFGELIEVCAFIDICSCYEFMDAPSKKQEVEWSKMRGEYKPEPTTENASFYVTEPDGTEYFYHGNTRIKVTEHFNDNGKPMNDLVEDVVQFAAQN